MKFFLILSTLSVTLLYGSPNGFQIIEGKASYHNNAPGQHTIQSSTDAIIQWDQFSLTQAESAHFQQPGVSSKVLNRISGGKLSEIYGGLSSNGKIYFVNPAGIVIGPNATIDCAGFLASTADISNEDFLSDAPILLKNFSKESIINFGTIQTFSGNVTLLASHIENHGEIEAANGAIHFGSAPEILLKPEDSNGIYILPCKDSLSNGSGITQLGSLKALVIDIQASGNPYSQAINTQGTLEALSIENVGGRIEIINHTGQTHVQGNLTAPGGTIHLLGKEVQIKEGSTIQTSSPFNGGEILIGGDYQGLNPNILNAQTTTTEPNTYIQADALEQGDGGTVIFWSDGITTVESQTSVRGGKHGGNGGFVEVSGVKGYIYNGLTDRRAPQGKNGTLLFDPDANIIINAAGPDTNITPATPFEPTGTNAILTTTTLQNELALGNVIVQTNGTFPGLGQNGQITISSPLSWSDSTLTLDARHQIAFNSNITCGGTGSLVARTNRNITIGAGNAVVHNGTSGRIEFEARGLITDGAYDGVAVIGAGTRITSSFADIIITGRSVNTANFRSGVDINNNGVIESIGTGPNSANITIDGEGGNFGSANSEGISISGSSLATIGGKVRSIDGDITILGVGGGTNFVSQGVELRNPGSEISTSGSGNISITGIGAPNGTNFTHGVIAGDRSIIQASGSGNITINGTGGGTAFSSEGMRILDQSQILSNSGNITMTLQGAPNGTYDCSGLQVDRDATIRSTSGNISITATGGGTQYGGIGVDVTDGGSIIADSGVLNISGIGSSNGTSDCHGIQVTQTLGTYSGGRIVGGGTLTGTATGTIGPNHGIVVSDEGTISNTGGVPLNLLGSVNAGGTNGYAIEIRDLGSAVTSSNSPITFTGIQGVTGEGIRVTNEAVVSGGQNVTFFGYDDIEISEGGSVTTLRNLFMDATRNIYVIGGNTVTTNTVVSSNLYGLLKADLNIEILNGSTSTPQISSGTNLHLVCDDAFPNYPDRGPGQFIIESDGIVSAANELRVYTVQPSQNTINAPLNGGAFIPGPFGVDTLTEKWLRWWSDGPFGGPLFTVYYKVGIAPSIIVDATIAVEQAEAILPVIRFDQLNTFPITSPYHGQFCRCKGWEEGKEHCQLEWYERYKCDPEFQPYDSFIFEDDIYHTSSENE